MTAIELLHDTQRRAGLNITAFAATLGISQSLLSMIYQGKRTVTHRTLARLGGAFPQTTPELTTLFFPGKYAKTNRCIPTVI